MVCLPNGFDALDVFREMLHMQFNHIEDRDANFFLSPALEADGLFERAGGMNKQIHDVAAVGAVQRERRVKFAVGVRPTFRPLHL